MPIKKELKFQKCGSCQTEITNAVAVLAFGDVLHHTCFKCVACNQWLRAGEEYTKTKDVIMCMECMKKQEKDACAGCKRELNDRVVVAMNSRWHFNCFVCSTCRRPLADVGYFLVNANPFCSEHFWQLQGHLRITKL
uniref:LIM zinc-binding domain-containing protein n=1 Tax=Trichuris muris TaxID=70415 RepID=A0A5S6QUJ3_TRIMR